MYILLVVFHLITPEEILYGKYVGTIAKQSKLYNKLIANVLEISYL